MLICIGRFPDNIVFTCGSLFAFGFFVRSQLLNASFNPNPSFWVNCADELDFGKCRSHGLAGILGFNENRFWGIMRSFLEKVNHFRVCLRGTYIVHLAECPN